MAEAIKKHRLHRALDRQQNGSSANFEDDLEGDAPPDAQEAAMRAEMAEMTSVFKRSVRRLKDLKAEIEHRKHLIESMNIRLVQAFQKWWADQEREQMLAKGHPAQPQAWETPPLTPVRRGSASGPLPDIPSSYGPSREVTRPPSSRGLSTASSSVSLSPSRPPLPQQRPPTASGGATGPGAVRPPSAGVTELGGTSTGDPMLDAAISSFFSDRRRAKGNALTFL